MIQESYELSQKFKTVTVEHPIQELDVKLAENDV